MEKREYDLFAATLANPDMSFNGLVANGLTAENTSLQDKSVYLNDEWVRSQIVDSNGKFDLKKFDETYEAVRSSYDALATTSWKQAALASAVYDKNDIFVAPSRRAKNQPGFIETKEANPQHFIESIVSLGVRSAPQKSVSELAQSNKVLLNPVEAEKDPSKAQWGRSAEGLLGGFFPYFFDTLVLAQYDQEGTHKDPITGEIVHHEKGEYKVNEDGEYYYEKLDGRPVYDKLVLNKTNLLTQEDSWLNQYDPFDSDGVFEKNAGAALIKNAAIAGSFFLPYGIGAGILAGTLVTQLAGLGATFTKMLTGSDNSTMSNIEGWAKSMNPAEAKTEYSKQHAWTWENGFSLIGDVATQLLQQRYLFTNAGRLFGRVNPYSKSGAEKLTKLFEDNFNKWADKKLVEINAKAENSLELVRAQKELLVARDYQIALDREAYLKGYNKIGEVLGKGYMTGITVADTYGEAKNAGASDTEAALLTLGYAAAEYGLLSTGLGEWIMPELRAEGNRFKAIGKGLAELRSGNATQAAEKAVADAATEEKLSFIKRAFNIGKKIFNAEYATGTRTVNATVAAGLGEGFEEVSEEFLADFSKTMFNLSRWVAGDETRLDSFGYNFERGEWSGSELIDRYGMSLIGGFFGGGIANAKINYQDARNLKGMTSQRALLEVIYMVRNGEDAKFLKALDKMELSPTGRYKSTRMERDSKGNIVYMPGTATDNQELAMKNAIREQIGLIKEMITSNGAGLSDQSFLNKQVLADLRFGVLTKSATAGRYLMEYNKLSAELASAVQAYNSLNTSSKDTNNNGKVEDSEERHSTPTEADKTALTNARNKVNEIQQQIEDLTSGKRSYEFIADSLYEMSSVLSGKVAQTNFAFYAKTKTGKEVSELAPEELHTLRDEYKIWVKSNGTDKVALMSSMFRGVLEKLSPVLINLADVYLNPPKELVQFENFILSFGDASTLQQDEDGNDLSDDEILTRVLERAQKEIGTLTGQLARALAPDQRKYLESLELDERAKESARIVRERIAPFIDTIKTRGFINSNTKEPLIKVLDHLRDVANKESSFLSMQIDDLNNAGINTPEDVVLLSELEAARDEATVMSQNMLKYQDDLNALDESPLFKNINEFALLAGMEPLNFSELIARVNSIFADSLSDVAQFDLDNATLEAINQAFELIELYSTALYAARRDSIGLGNFWGYTATLNEINSKTGNEHAELAEIDSRVADNFLEELTKILKRLEYINYVYNLATQQKLASADKVAAKKDVLIYKKYLETLLHSSSSLKAWVGFKDFRDYVQTSMPTHAEILTSDNLALKEEDKRKLLKERIGFENAVYDFFHKNEDKLADPEATKDFFGHFNLYSRQKEIFTEKSDYIDDASIVWWTAARVALKGEAFYKMYKDAAGNDLAPLAPQELAVYNNVAHVVNAPIFEQFARGYRQYIKDDYKGKSPAERQDVLRNVDGITDAATLNYFSTDEQADKCLNFLPCVRYMNMVLTEGIPGAGKSGAVMVLTSRILKKFYPKIMEKALVVHGINGTNEIDGKKLTKAEQFRKALGLPDTVKAWNKEQFMSDVVIDWEDYLTTGAQVAQIPTDKGELNADNEYVHNAKINTTGEKPTIVFLDELSQFSAFDFDSVQQWARELGITVLCAGDFDQNQFRAEYTPAGEPALNLTLARDTMPHCPKLGISMRTDNKIMSANIEKFQAWKQNPTDSVTLEYYEDAEEGLFGVKRSTSYDHGSQAALITEVETQIEAMKNTLAPGEKIGFIYTDPNSPVAKELLQPKWRGLIEPMSGISAQGGEAQYYICDIHQRDFKRDAADTEGDADAFNAALYTGISRAEQGCYIILSNLDPKVNTTKVDNNIKDTKKAEAYKRYAEKYQERITEALPDSVIIPDPVEHAHPRSTTGGSVAAAAAAATTVTARWNAGDIIDYNGEMYFITDIDGTDYVVEKGGVESRIPIADMESSGTLMPSSHALNKFVPGLLLIYEGHVYKVIDIDHDADTYDLAAQDGSSNRILKISEVDDSATEASIPEGMVPDSPYKAIVEGSTMSDLWPGYYNYNGMPMIVVDIVPGAGYNIPFYQSNDGRWHAFFGLEQEPTTGDWYMISGSFEHNGVNVVRATEDMLNNTFDWEYDTQWNDDNTNKYLPNKLLTPEEINNLISPDETPTATDAFRLKFLNQFGAPIAMPDSYSTEYEDVVEDEVAEDTASEADMKRGILENQSSVLEEEVITPRDGVIAMRTLLHSFNTFELGLTDADIDEDGFPLFNDPLPLAEYQGRQVVPRIDSIRGLVNLDELHGKRRRKVSSYIPMIGELRNIAFHGETKEDIVKAVKAFYKRRGIDLEDSFYCKFMFKSSPYIAQDNPSEYIGNAMYPYGKGKSERTLYNGSQDVLSNWTHAKTLSIVFGDAKHNNLMELPLFSLTSPFTLISSIDPDTKLPRYGDLYESYKAKLDAKVPLHDISSQLQAEFKGRREYHDILSMFELFDYTSGGAFYFDGPEFDTWTPYKDLEYIGPRFTQSRGYYQVEEGRSFDVDNYAPEAWETVSDFSRKPHGTMSSHIFVDTTNTNVSGQKRGHPFVLWTLDPSLKTDEAMMAQLQKLNLDPNEKQKVLAIYILPPKASLELYFLNIIDIFTKKSADHHIGNIRTSYRMFQALRNNEDFKTLFEKKHPNNPNAWAMLEQLLDDVHKTSDLFGTVTNFGAYGYGHKPINRGYLLDRLLAETVYDQHQIQQADNSVVIQFTPDTSALQTVTLLLEAQDITGVYYRTSLPKKSLSERPIHGVNVIAGKQGADPSQWYTVDGLPYRLHGKIDMVTMRGDIHNIVDMVLRKRRYNQNRNGSIAYYSDDNKFYIFGETPHYAPVTPEEKMINYAHRKVGFDAAERAIILNFFATSNDEGVNRLVNYINQRKSGNVAVRLGDAPVVSQSINELKGKTIRILDTMRRPITKVEGTGTGLVKFIIEATENGNTTLYNAEIKILSSGHNWTINQIIETPPTPPTPPSVGDSSGDTLITEERFNEIQALRGKVLQIIGTRPNSPLGKLFNRNINPDVLNLLMAESYEDFIDTIDPDNWDSNSWERDDRNHVNPESYTDAGGTTYYGRNSLIMKAADLVADDPELLHLLQDIAEIESRADEAPTCGINIYSK